MPEGSSRLPAPFGKYLLSELIAVGGMAEVYRAKIFGASGFEKEMVVKRILPKYASNPNFVQMLIDEAKIAVSLSHGNIVPIYELGELDGSYYIAMEYVEGRTVLDILRDAHSKKHPLPWAYCLGIAADVAKGLAYAHARSDPFGKPLGLVHRDINPRNIVVTPSGEVKILDFGIARASTKRHQTASGVIKGTPGYMSPEQMYGHSVDARSDIYCLGILVYELLTLRRLFPVWDVNEMRAVFEAGPIPLPSSIARHVDKIVDGVIMKALTQDISQRFQSAGDFEEALRTVIAKSGTAVTATGLAREVKAIDDAPGPRAPRTAPPVVESSSASHAASPSLSGPSSPTSPVPPSSPPSPRSPVPLPMPQQPQVQQPLMQQPQMSASPAVSPLHAPQPSPARSQVPTEKNPLAPRTPMSAPMPTPSAATANNGRMNGAGGAGAGHVEPFSSSAAIPNAAGPFKTQPMPLPTAPAADLDAAHSFVISLAGKPSDTDRNRAAEGLPQLDAKAVSKGHRTQVLAQNAGIAWAGEIGEDAEILALMKATGAHPSSGRRTILVAAAVLAVCGALVFAFAGNDIIRVVKRAMSGQKAEPGTIIVKTIPSGADVTIDGKNRGHTNMKVTGYDINEPHRLVVKPKDKDPVVLEIEKKDFVEGEDGSPTYLFEKDYSPPKDPKPEG